MERKRGEILYGKDPEAEHYIIFWAGHDDNFFIGCMVTHSDGYENIPMEKGHFYEKDAAGKDYRFAFDKTHLVPAYLFKPIEWQPFNKVGQLTDEGISFVDSKIDDSIPQLWEDYKRQGGTV